MPMKMMNVVKLLLTPYHFQENYIICGYSFVNCHTVKCMQMMYSVDLLKNTDMQIMRSIKLKRIKRTFGYFQLSAE